LDRDAGVKLMKAVLAP